MKTLPTPAHLPSGNVLTWNRASTIQSKKKVLSKRACRKAALREEIRRGDLRG